MAFIKFIPFGKKTPYDLTTTTRPENQLWAELSILRHLTGRSAIYGKAVTAPWIDQGKIYFLDSCNCSWKSSGLLYYYSFLNIAKALIVKNRTTSGIFLRSTSIYHGLSADIQAPRSIIDFEIKIHPTIQNGKRNIFALLYKNITNSPWPFHNTITIKLADFINYCDDISHEVQSFYGINKKSIQVQSLIREYNNHLWFEIAFNNQFIPEIQCIFINQNPSIIPFTGNVQIDKDDWFSSYDRSANSLLNHSFVRLFQLPFTSQNRTNILQSIVNDAVDSVKKYICPVPVLDTSINFWYLIPEIQISGSRLLWKPLLSNYLFSFVLSSILRYQPHLFDINSKDAFIAEAWCNQCATTTLRYLLMEFTSPPVRLN